MELRYIDLDTRLDAIQDRFWGLTATQRARWDELEHVAWLYHELQLEGVGVRPSDIARARAGEEGADYCDRVLLEQIRRADALLHQVRDQAQAGEALTVPTLRQWVAQLDANAGDVAFRKKDGPTEHYKHEVLAPKEILNALEALLERTQSDDAGHALEVALELLYQIGKIWPFSQWSGMCARLAASYILIEAGYPPWILPARERMNFYQAYHHEPSRMKDLFLHGVEGIFASKDVFIQERGELNTLELEEYTP